MIFYSSHFNPMILLLKDIDGSLIIARLTPNTKKNNQVLDANISDC
jgi:hypothetical protein